MAASTIGALRVVLGADTAAFSKGIRQAETRLSGFGAAIKRAGPIIATALGAAVVTLGASIKRTIDDADTLAKTSQKIGVGVEELQRLAHAADLSGVSFETLVKGVQRFSRNILEGAQGLQTPIRAFKLLGIEIRNADGTLKNVEQALPEIADAFAGMEDGATKTGVAMQLFGRAGAELIPLLNTGAAGMRKLMDETDQLGGVISTEAALAAEEFNDNLSRLSDVGMSGLITIVNAVAPTLADLSDTMVTVSKTVGNLRLALTELTSEKNSVASFFANAASNALSALNPIQRVWAAIVGIKEASAEVTLNIAPPPAEEAGNNPTIEDEIEKRKQLAEATRLASEAEQAQNEIRREAESLVYAMATPLQQYQTELDEINRLHKAGAIDAVQYQQALKWAAEQSGANWASASEDIAGSFANIGQSFGRESSKMARAGQIFGAVQATISAFTGAAKALELPFPANLAAMAAVLAKGLGFAASIKSQRIPSYNQGADFMVGGMGGIDNNLIAFNATRGERVRVDPVGHDSDKHRPEITEVHLHGGAKLGEPFIRELIDQFNTAAKNGKRLVMAPA